MKEVKKMLNAKLERHLAKPHTLLYEVSTLYIYIYIDDDDDDYYYYYYYY